MDGPVGGCVIAGVWFGSVGRIWAWAWAWASSVFWGRGGDVSRQDRTGQARNVIYIIQSIRHLS